MAHIRLNNLNKTFDKGVVAVSGFDLEIKSGEFACIVGPSGCGKSTVLRMIAGLETPSAGDIYIGGERVNDVPPKDRDIAMIFQDYALYPSLTVYDNLALGLKLRKTPKDKINESVMSAAEILNITELLDRKPSALSGGERQRVALGRVLVRRPKVFLLDEPLSGIDAKFRAEMRTQIVELHKKTGITFVYVTHDQTEAMTMARKIIVMNNGRIVQTDTPSVLYDNPNSVFTATFIGMPQMNIIPAERNGDIVSIGGKAVKMTADLFDDTSRLLVGVRPEYIKIGTGDFEGTLTALEQLGNETILYFNTPWKRNIIAVSADGVTVTAGQAFKFSLDLSKAVIFDRATESSISGIPAYNEITLKGFSTDKLLVRQIGGEALRVAVPPDGFVLGSGVHAEIISIKKYNDVSVCKISLDDGTVVIAKLHGADLNAGDKVQLDINQSKAVLLSADGTPLSAKHIEKPFVKISLTENKGQNKTTGIITDIEFVGETAVLRIKSGKNEFSAISEDYSVDIWIGKKIKYAKIT